jgi:hypothetical protein
MLHTPGSTGTILSPDRYMKDTSDVHEFRHNGSMDSKGNISFHDIHDTTMSEIDMKRRRDGLWFTTNPVLKPPLFPTGNTKTPKATTTRSIHSANIATGIHDEANKMPPIDQRDSEDQATVQTQSQDRHDTQSLSEDSTSTTDNEQSGVSIRTSNWTRPLSKAIQHLELWHQ